MAQALVTAESFRGFDLRFDELNSRLKSVKREFGLKRAVSTRSLTGETRTFAEILDQQVENIVLYYLEVQGILSKQTRVLRNKQVRDLQDYTVTLDLIENLCQKYRDIGAEIVELLNYLERNSIALRKILRRHDALFDQRMGSMYFDSRLTANTRDSQLRQLYHQEGIRAILGSIRRGFEELYDARKALLENADGDLSFTPFAVNASVAKWSTKTKCVPKISFRKRLQSFSNFQALIPQRADPSAPGGPAASDIELGDLRATNTRTKSASSLFVLTGTHQPDEDEEGRKRSLSELEPVLARVADLANRLMKTQSSTAMEFLSTHSSLGLEFKMRDMQIEEEGEADADAAKERVVTDRTGLFLNNFLTFLYLANQYVVAPSSAEYATRLGMSSSMSGMIIGLTPAAALVSSLVYSMWSNHSFKTPLLVSITCGVLGNLLYGMALQCDSAPLILAGRLLTGFGGPRVVSRRYIADHVALHDRLMASSQFVTAGALGLACGPLIASIVEALDLSFTLRGWGGAVLVQYEKVTASGWLMALLWAGAFCGVFLFFREPVITKVAPASAASEEERSLLGSHRADYNTRAGPRERERERQRQVSPSEDVVFVESGAELWGADDDGRATDRSPHRPDGAKKFEPVLPEPVLPAPTPVKGSEHYQAADLAHLNRFLRDRERERELSCWDHISLEVHAILFLYIVNKAGQELTVSSMPMLLKQLFGWRPEAVGYYMAVIGSLVLPTNLMVNFASKEVEERDMVARLTGVAMVGVAVVMHLVVAEPYALWQYVLGTCVVFTALNALEGVIMSLLAKLLSPELARGTFNSGLLATEAGTFGRVVGDMAITAIGESVSASGALVNELFLPLAVLLTLSAVVVYHCYDRLAD